MAALIVVVAIAALMTLGSSIFGTLHYDWQTMSQVAPR